MAKFRRRPVIVEAKQFRFSTKPLPTGVEVAWVDQYDDQLVLCAFKEEPNRPANLCYGLRTPVGWFVVKLGDWIITDANGKRWVCEGKEFENLYEPMTP